jgi:hypothetical protein
MNRKQVIKVIASIVLSRGLLLSLWAKGFNRKKQRLTQTAFARARRGALPNRPKPKCEGGHLDTQTGKIWIPTQYTNAKGQPTLWQAQERVGSEEELSEWQKRQVNTK